MTTQPRIPLDDLTSDALDQLYARLDQAEHVARSAARDAALALTAQLVAEAECDRYRAAWTSARHRASIYLQSNQNFAASIENSHAAYLQLAAEVARLTARRAPTT
ncbi:hypothetical protein [Streptomyces californicus]|uniref:hypothetical protein n=1 Tax=Streptomyces californicus TaxID=67351 RepID=UPI0004BEAEAE|nr:hypothetical protein [Streptomyces californicus]QRV56644.1 hypothetical protein I6J40_22415 [Streptomyces californicus]